MYTPASNNKDAEKLETSVTNINHELARVLSMLGQAHTPQIDNRGIWIICGLLR